MVKVAVVGCGAVAERSYVPALARTSGISAVAFADPDRNRAQKLASNFDSAIVSENYKDVLDEVEAVIVAAPNHLHYKIGLDCLQKGKHVLIEKPLALTSDNCDTLNSAAEKKGLTLAVGLVRRFLYSSRVVKDIIGSGSLGDIESFEIKEGGIFNWPATSGYFLNKQQAGGGVLVDTGAHVLDSLIWWLGVPCDFEYADDQCGGVEADCVLHLTMDNGARGKVVLSRIRNLNNTAKFVGEKATLIVATNSNKISLLPNGSCLCLSGNGISIAMNETQDQTTIDLFCAQLRNWVGAMTGREGLISDGLTGSCSIQLIEACYANRRNLRQIW